MNLKSTSPNSLTEAVRRKWRTPEQCITGEGEALFQQSSLLREETRVLGIPKLFYGKLCFMKLEKLLSVSFPQILGVRHPRILLSLSSLSLFFCSFATQEGKQHLLGGSTGAVDGCHEGNLVG